MVKYEWKSMPSEVRLKKNNRTIKRGPKKLNFGASKPGVGGAQAPRAPLEIWNMVKYEWKSMPSEVRLKKNNRTIKRGPKKLNFGASKPGVGGAQAPRAPLDPLV